MTTINLKDFYYWYLTDELLEVPDEVAEELMASKRREAAHAERVRYKKAYYLSLIHILFGGRWTPRPRWWGNGRMLTASRIKSG